MIRMTKQADYGIVLMAYFALDGERLVHNARDLADKARLPQPTVTKVLKALARGGLLVSQRGVKGGYRLARSPEGISVAEIIAALEGPIAITQCAHHGSGCDQEAYCPCQPNWQLIDRAVRSALEAVSLRDISQRALMPRRAPELERRVEAAARGAVRGGSDLDLEVDLQRGGS